jgi:hypothetical protein
MRSVVYIYLAFYLSAMNSYPAPNISWRYCRCRFLSRKHISVHFTNDLTITMATEPTLSTDDIKVIGSATAQHSKRSVRKRVWVRFWNPRARHTRRAALMGWMEGVWIWDWGWEWDIDKLAEQIDRDKCLEARKQHYTTAILNSTDSAFRKLSPPGPSLWPWAYLYLMLLAIWESPLTLKI